MLYLYYLERHPQVRGVIYYCNRQPQDKGIIILFQYRSKLCSLDKDLVRHICIHNVLIAL